MLLSAHSTPKQFLGIIFHPWAAHSAPSNDQHCLVSLATKGVAPLLEEASPNVPRQMHRAAAAAEEECASLSVKGRGVGLGLGVYIEPVLVVCLEIFWLVTTRPPLPYLTRPLLTITHQTIVPCQFSVDGTPL